MDEWVTLFKSNPLVAIGGMIVAGGAYLLKNRSEKAVDSKEVLRLTTALEVVIKERDEERDRADEAFKRQLELTERFSDMRAQNERLLERMEQVSKQVANMAEDNIALRDQVKTLTGQNRELSEQVRRLQSTIDSGTPR